MKRKLRKPVVAVATCIVMGCTAIPISNLFASPSYIYGEQESLLIAHTEFASITQIDAKKGVETIASCTLQKEDENSLCKGFTLKEDGLYQNAALKTGEINEHLYTPYTYEVKYVDTKANSKQETIQFDRLKKSAIKSFTGKKLVLGENELVIEGDYDEVFFTTDDSEHVSFEGTRAIVKAGAKPTISITAHDTGNQIVSGGEQTAQFTFEAVQDKKVEATVATVYDPSNFSMFSMGTQDADTWYGNRSTLQLNIELENRYEQYTKDFDGNPIDNHQIELQAQYVDILTDSNVDESLSKDVIRSGSLTQAQVNALFAGKEWVKGTTLDTSQAYVDPANTSGNTDLTWIQSLQVTYPKQEGVYLIRYRLFNHYSQECVPLTVNDNVYGSLDGYFDYRKIIGQDFSAPEVELSAKRKGESIFTETTEDEVFTEGTQVKVTYNADIIGVREARYRFVNNADVKETAYNEIPQDGILVVPANLDGYLEVVVSDNLDEAQDVYRSTKVTRNVQQVKNHVVVTLPAANNTWQSKESMEVQLTEPQLNPVDYDGVLLTLQNNTRATKTKFIAKAEFQNGKYSLKLEDGDFTIHAEVVKNTGTIENPLYTIVDELSVADTKIKIDRTAKITAEKGSLVNNTYPITLKGTSGPSGIAKVERTLVTKASDGKETTYQSTIALDTDGKAIDNALLNGTYTYVLINHAGMKSDPVVMNIEGIEKNLLPVLNVTAIDQDGKSVSSGAIVNEYIKIKAENMNSNSDPSKKVQICINNQCQNYTFGQEVKVDKNAKIVFKTTSNEVLNEFDIKIKSNLNLGTITIKNEASFGEKVWLNKDANVEVQLTNNDEGVYLETKINNGTYTKLNGIDTIIPLTIPDETSKRFEVYVRSTNGTEVSEEKKVYVNIDKVTPVLTISKTAYLNGQRASLSAYVGGSGLQKATVRYANEAMQNLAVKDNKISDFLMLRNGTYIFEITGNNGRKDTKQVVINEIDESQLRMEATTKSKDGVISMYEGGWTNQLVNIKLYGGLANMTNLASYQVSKDKTTWENISDNVSFDEEQNATYYFRVMKKDGEAGAPSNGNLVKIDRTAPSNPAFDFTAIHTDALSMFMRSITFNTFYKEGAKASITSNDALSKVQVYYQFGESDGSFQEDLTSTSWKSYKDSLTLSEEGKIVLYAYACDEAGNCSSITNSDGYVFDFTKPIIKGIDEASGYIPRKVSWSDALSGIDETKTKVTLDDKVQSVTSPTLIKTVGSYTFEIFDQAGNYTKASFTLKKIPSPGDVSGDDEWKDIIEDIIEEFDKNKDDLDDNTKEDIEDQIKDMEDAFHNQRVPRLEDPETGATLEGIKDTTFPKKASLKVRRISDALNDDEISVYAAGVKPYYLSDVYEVSIELDGKAQKLEGKAKLTFAVENDVDKIAYLAKDFTQLTFEQVNKNIVMEISNLGRYGLLSQHIDDSLDKEESKLQVDAYIVKANQEKSYDGKWTKENIKLKLSKGVSDASALKTYQMSSDLVNWEDVSSEILLHEDQNKSYSFRVLKKDGTTGRVSKATSVKIDASTPQIIGIDQVSGYIPRKVSWSDGLSGIDETKTRIQLNDKKQEVTSPMVLKEVGNYTFEISDNAGNQAQKNFTLKKIPNRDEVNGDDEWKDIIDDIIDELEKNKDHLDDETIKDIEDQIKDLENAYKEQRTNYLEDKETNATLEGIGDTTFAKNATLKVRRINDTLSKDEVNAYEKGVQPLFLSDVYEVTIEVDGKPQTLLGKAKLTFEVDKEVKGITYLSNGFTDLAFQQNNNTVQLEIEKLGRYGLLSDNENDRIDNDVMDPPSEDDSDKKVNGSYVNKSFGGSTGDFTLISLWGALFITSLLLIEVIALKKRINK